MIFDVCSCLSALLAFARVYLRFRSLFREPVCPPPKGPVAPHPGPPRRVSRVVCTPEVLSVRVLRYTLTLSSGES